MKKMQEFREWLFVTHETSTTIQNRLNALTNFSRKQVNALTRFEPWSIWGESEFVKQA